MSIHPELSPEIEINQNYKGRNFGAFLNLNIKTTKLFLKNGAYGVDDFFQRNPKEQAIFLEQHGPLIKQLRVEEFSLYCCGKEWDFLEGLVNLESFEAGFFGMGRGRMGGSLAELEKACSEKITRAWQDPRFMCHNIPEIFKKLKRVKVGQIPGEAFANILDRTGGFFEKCEALEFASFPYNSYADFLNFASLGQVVVDRRYNLARAFLFIDYYIENPSKMNGTTLKCFDFACYHEEQGAASLQSHLNGSMAFLKLLRRCLTHQVLLKNVAPFWFAYREAMPEFRNPDLGVPVVSMIGLHPCVLSLKFPNLEKVELRTLAQTSPGTRWRENRMYLPGLKSLSIHSDRKHIRCQEWDHGREPRQFLMDGREIFNFFFEGICRQRMEELNLSFQIGAGRVALPRAEDIVTACPNLKRIKLVAWPGTDVELVKLWNGLPGLEEVSLEHCKYVGNAAFVGEDVKNPVFLKLKSKNSKKC